MTGRIITIKLAKIRNDNIYEKVQAINIKDKPREGHLILIYHVLRRQPNASS